MNSNGLTADGASEAYAEPKSYKECAEKLLRLGERFASVRASKGYSDADARCVALTNCGDVCFATVLILNLLAAGEEGRIGDAMLRPLLGITSGSTQNAANVIEKCQRLSFVFLIQFQIENLLSNLLRELQGMAAPNGFWNIASEVVKGLPDPARKLELLNVPALVRNSLHSNGIHHGYKGTSSSTMIDGVTFSFDHLKPVTCAGWGHIALACDSSLNVVEEILDTKAVHALKDPIMDRYAWEQATKP